jgi:hypothetical protein
MKMAEAYSLCNHMWKKFGDRFDYDDMKNLVGFGNLVSKRLFGKWMIEWRGGEKSETLLNNYINEKNSSPIHIKNGGYDFNYEIIYIDVDNVFCEVIIKCSVDLSGTVTLIMTTDETLTLYDAIRDLDFGWEIKDEIRDCIYDDLTPDIIGKIGYSVSIGIIDY